MTDDDYLVTINRTDVLGDILGGPCEDSCRENLPHVVCNKKTSICECEPGFPVRLGETIGCAKPVSLGDQCFYYQTCTHTDQNADCVQIKHNAICQCKKGYHSVTVQKPIKRIFCSQDLVVIATDQSTLLGVATGLAIFTALICFVLRLFVGSRPRHYANTNLTPPIIFAQSGMSGVSVLRGGCTRGSRGVLVPSSRAGAARAAAILLISCHLSPSHASVHSSTSSTKSFSARQYERERENRLLAKARERERGDGGSTSPRSIENLIDGPMPSESWPQLEDVKLKPFSPEMLEDPPDIPFPDIDQIDGIENPLGPQIEQVHIVENPVAPQDPLRAT
ncbi:uncharacterized protein [Halyomorpha halys]|uniref:uncharacterized protein isoform X1 n=1 Tax=Halyomorpha halys TaxID=286706 RepID=UPI0006D51F45|nr:uncharacterized protein LOC106684340 isoform X2 [Halyomorpha halys]